MRRALPFLLLLALAGCGGGASLADLVDRLEGGGGDDPAIPAADPAASADQVLLLVNGERVSRGLAPLAWHDGAAAVALSHSADMAARGFFDHVDPDGAGPADRLAEAGIDASGWGENLARGQPDASSAVAAWMDSEGHRANILHPDFTHLGVGRAEGPSGPYWTQVFLRLP